MLRGAFIGFGNAALDSHWPAYAKSSEAHIVAVVDRSAERRAIAQKLSPAIPSYDSIENLAAEETIDFVDICTPPALHFEPMIEALNRGWHVLCEKPFLVEFDHFDIARQRAREAGRCLMPVHNWKYAPIIRRATQALRAGAIGRLQRVEIKTLRVKDCAASDPLQTNWRRSSALAGGGILMDHGWHAVYLALSWFREKPIDLRASLRRPRPDTVEDEATLNIMFPSGEAAISLSWNADVRSNTICLLGQRGEILINDDILQLGGESIRFDRALSSGSHHEDWFAAMLPDVIAAFHNHNAAAEALDEAALCLSVIRRAYEITSARAPATALADAPDSGAVKHCH